MRPLLGRMLAGSLFLLGSGGIAPGQAQGAPGPDEIAALVQDLSADSYDEREAASKRLVQAGDTAIEPLAQSLASGDPEVAWRASVALERLALAGNETTLARVAAAMQKVERSGGADMAAAIQELRTRQAKIKHDRAATQLQKLGASLAGGSAGEAEGFAFGILGGAVPIFLYPGDDVGPVPLDIDVAEVEIPAIDAGPPVGAPIAESTPVEDKPADEVPSIEPPAAELAKLELAAKPAEEAETPAPDAIPADLDPLAPPPIAPAEAPDVAAGAAIADAFVGDDVAVDLAADPFAAPADREETAKSTLPPEVLVLGSAWRGGDDGLATLADLPNVAAVQIESAKLTDAALEHLARLPNLGDLQIRGEGRITPEGLRKFRKKLPTTKIYAQGQALMGVNADRGGPCVLTSVFPGTGAAEAGLLAGDEIVAIEGAPVRDFSDLTICVFREKPGKKLRVEFKREGKQQTVLVTLKDRATIEMAP